MHWLTSTATSTRRLGRRAHDIARRLARRRIPISSVASTAVELAGAAWFFWALHETWPPLAGLVGGPLVVLVGMSIETSKGEDVEG